MTRREITWALSALAILLAAAPAAGEYIWERHLFGNDIQDLAYRDGALWWATRSGLVRMEVADESLTIFRRSDRGLPSDSLNALAFDADGNLWCGTKSGGIAVRMARGGWEFLRTFDGLPNPRVLALAARGPQVTAGTREGYATFNGLGEVTDACTVIDPCVDILPSLVIQSVLAYDNTIWYGTGAGPVRHLTTDPDDPFLPVLEGLGSTVVRSMIRFQNDVWLGTDDGAYRFNPADSTWTPTPGVLDGNGQPADVLDLLDAGGQLLCASRSGRRVFAWSGTTWEIFGAGSFSSRASPQALALDGNGDIWVGTRGGLRRYDRTGDSWLSPILVSGTPADAPVWSVATGGEDEAWIGYRLEMAGAWREGKWVGISNSSTGGSPDDGFENRPVQGLFVDSDSRIWFGHCCCTSADCFMDRARGSDPSNLSWERIPARNIRALAEDGLGRVFMGSAAEDPAVVGDALFLWQPNFPADSVFTFTDDATPLLSNTVSALSFDPQGRLWIGYREDGVHVWSYGADPTDGLNDTWVRYHSDGDADHFLISNQVLSMAADGNQIWVGTALGVSLYENGVHRGSWGSSSLGNPFVTAMTTTIDHSAWAGTPDGIVQFVPNAVGTWDIERYEFPDLSSNGINGLAADGLNVWVATERGVTMGRPADTGDAGPGGKVAGSVYPNPFRPGLHEGIRLFDVTAVVSGVVYDAVGGVISRFEDVSPGDVVWNGRVDGDAGGERVAPGIYAIVARAGNLTVTARVAVVW